jgi:hypothetical protein
MSVNYETDGAPSSEATGQSDKNFEDVVLAYIIFGQDSSNGWTGAVMMTDSRTRPLHFGFATPIRPGTIQRLLYGSTFEEYVKVDVISNKLIHELPHVPDVMFVENADLLAVRRVAAFPVVSLSRPVSVTHSD